MIRAQPDGYLATPAAGSGVLVLHAWWGLNDTIRAVCDRLAAAGFVALAPDLTSQAAYVGHFGEEDEYEPESSVASPEESLHQAGCPVTFHRYPGAGHWFFEADRSDAHDEEAAELAWVRTLAFLEEAVR